MEKLCKILSPLIHFRKYPYTNLINQIIIWNQFSHLQYFLDINKRIFEVIIYEENKPENDRIFWCNEIAEVLLPLRWKYNLSSSENKLLRHYYRNALEVITAKLEIIFYFISDFFFDFINCFLLVIFFSGWNLHQIVNKRQNYYKLTV